MRKSLSVVLGLLFSYALYSQEDTLTDPDIPGIRQGWTIEISGGGNVLFSKDSRLNHGIGNLRPDIALSVGKWFSPSVGTRIQLSGYSLAAGSTSEGVYLADPLPNGMYGNADPVRDWVRIRPDGSYTYTIYYLQAHVDVILSVRHMFKAILPMACRWDVVPALGLGYMHVFGYRGVPSTDVMTMHFSLMGKYKVAPEWDLFIEASSVLMPDMFEGRITGSPVDPMFSFRVGVSYSI